MQRPSYALTVTETYKPTLVNLQTSAGRYSPAIGRTFSNRHRTSITHTQESNMVHIIPALERYKQKDQDFKVDLDFTERCRPAWAT
jgi:hypothetical protein